MDRAVRTLWVATGVPPSFPREIEFPALTAFPVAVIELENLQLGTIQGWLAARGIGYRFPCADRRLHGCLLAYAGTGIIFLDAADDEDERRFSFAHELAHFSLDYLGPRADAMRCLGSGIVEVLDGYRPATPAERLKGILAGQPLGLFIDLMQRRAGGGIIHAETLASEARADRLALEWLAPPQAVQAALAQLTMGQSRRQRQQDATRLVARQFGLPAWVAERVARESLSRIEGPAQFAAWRRG